MNRHQKTPTGRPRGQQAAAPELENADSLTLARWGAAAASAGLTRSSAAQIAGISRRSLQRALRQHGADPLVARDLQLGEALKWESAGGRILEEAASRAVHWLRRCEAEGADLRETGAALAATIQAGHRLSEAGARRARRLQPEQPQQQNRADIGALIEQLAAAAESIKALPANQQDHAWATVRQQLRSDQQGQADPIDVAAVTVLPEAEASDPPACPL